jgi:hypothetical protein
MRSDALGRAADPGDVQYTATFCVWYPMTKFKLLGSRMLLLSYGLLILNTMLSHLFRVLLADWYPHRTCPRLSYESSRAARITQMLVAVQGHDHTKV